MSLTRLVAVLGFMFMFASFLLVFHLFLVAWVLGVDSMVVHLNKFGERNGELLLMFIGYCTIPITIYKFDEWYRATQ